MTESESVRLCGVRQARNGPLAFVDAGGFEPEAGQLVIVHLDGEERLAWVVFTPTQLVTSEIEVAAVGRVVRAATEDDLARLRAGNGSDNGALAAGLPESWTDWLAGPGDEPVLLVTNDGGGSTVGSLIARLFPDADASERKGVRRRTPESRGTPDAE